MTDTNEFNRRCALLRQLGADYRRASEYRGEVGAGRASVDLDLFSSVELPLTAEEWCDLCMNEGDEYVGGCCGLSGEIQDSVEHWFRFESGWPTCRSMHELAELWIAHGEREWESFENAIRRREPSDGMWAAGSTFEEIVAWVVAHRERARPWDLILLVYLIVRDFSAPPVPRAFGSHMSDMDKAISLLTREATLLSWSRLLADNEAPKRHDPQRALSLARMLPALRTIEAGIESMGPVLFTGFALIDVEEGADAIASNHRGLCLYESQAQADELLDLLEREQAQYQESPGKRPFARERFRVRPVQISTKDGLVVFTDTGVKPSNMEC